MAVQQIPSLIRKIQTLLSQNNAISQLEKDLCKEYLRDLYILIDELPVAEKYRKHYFPPPAPIQHGTLTPDNAIESNSISTSIPESDPVASIDDNVNTPFVESQNGIVSNGHDQSTELSMKKEGVAKLEKKEESSIQEVKEIEARVTDPIAEVITARVPTPTNYESLFESEGGKDLSDKLSRTPITDLTKAFSINDKLIIVSDLFKGNRESFQDTIDILNGKYSFDEAKTHLLRYVIDKYEWLDEKRTQQARDFIRLVERRYL